MEDNKIRVGITHGDINGIGYEIILKTFNDPVMFEFCTPIVYGSPKVATYHRKALNIDTNFSIINNATEAEDGRLNILPCVDDELKVEIGRPSNEAGQASLDALRKAIKDYRNGLIDVLVTAPVDNTTMQLGEYRYVEQSDYIAQALGEEQKALNIFVKDDFRVALATGYIAFGDVASSLTEQILKEKIEIFHHALVDDFGLDKPRIAVFSLNPHAGLKGLLGKEEQEIIIPAMQEATSEGILCFGPYSVDGLMGSGNYTHFDGILAMYHDQGLAAFKSLTAEEGVKYIGGLPIVYTSTVHGVAYDIAGQGKADENALRNAIYLALDIYRYRNNEEEIHANPLKKQYFDKRDDSYKLKLDSTDDTEDTL
ncbi:MAG: PdxA family dehydrogenase [Phocaeicola sp.]|uniref:PdxA family dehydrogenase n=1 Tax=Phocaeicola sp. TaxID=2773926 RepID=UPI003F9F5CF6